MGQQHSHDEPCDQSSEGPSRRARSWFHPLPRVPRRYPVCLGGGPRTQWRDGEGAAAARGWHRSRRQQARALLAWADPMRNGWHYVPRSRPGVALRDMSLRSRRRPPGT